jgi:hypothetical protein
MATNLVAIYRHHEETLIKAAINQLESGHPDAARATLDAARRERMNWVRLDFPVEYSRS